MRLIVEVISGDGTPTQIEFNSVFSFEVNPARHTAVVYDGDSVHNKVTLKNVTFVGGIR